MKYLKLFENFDEIEDDDVIFVAETQKGKYKVIVYLSDYDKERGSYSIREYTGKRSTGGGGGRGTKLDIEAWLNNKFDGSSKIDNINYIVKTNKQDFRILAINKDEPPRSERYFKQMLQGMGTGEPVVNPVPVNPVVVPPLHTPIIEPKLSDPMAPIAPIQK